MRWLCYDNGNGEQRKRGSKMAFLGIDTSTGTRGDRLLRGVRAITVGGGSDELRAIVEAWRVPIGRWGLELAAICAESGLILD